MRDRRLPSALLVLVTVACLGQWSTAAPVQARANRPADTTATLFPIADAYVDEGFPATNFNNSSTWPVARRETTGTERYPLLKFDLSTIPVGSQVTAAELRLFLESAEGDASVSITVSRITLAWNETTVKWNNRPPDQCCWDSLVVGQPTNQDRVWDIRTLVNNWVSGGNIVNHGLTLNGPATGFYGRFFEAVGARRPRLVISYIPPTATATATATRTATGTVTATSTATPTASATSTPTASPTNTATPTSTATWTPSATVTASSTASPTSPVTDTATPGTTASATATETGTAEPPPTDTATPSLTASATATDAGTATTPPVPSSTPTDSPSATATVTPSASVTATETPSATAPPATATGTASPGFYIYLPWLNKG